MREPAPALLALPLNSTEMISPELANTKLCEELPIDPIYLPDIKVVRLHKPLREGAFQYPISYAHS